jgi:hypothetical protein
VVAAAPFRDRVVHHALVRVIEPIFEKRFIEDSYAFRRGKGTHAAMRRAAEFARRFPFALKCDLRQYFASIDHATLRAALARVIADEGALWLTDLILASHVEGVELRWPEGAELFDAVACPRGLPIGNLTSQFFANAYLDGFDHFVKQELRVQGYLRYVDDFVLFGEEKAQLSAWGREVRDYVAGLRVEIHPDKYRLVRTATGLDFCGFVVRADGRIRVRNRGVRRFVRRYHRQHWEVKQGRLEASALTQSVRAWIAHVSHGQSVGLRRAVLSR